MIKSYKKFFILGLKQKKRIKKNIFSGISSEMTQILTQISFTPLMIYFWGIENFGVWIFLLAIPNIFSIFNVNFNNAAINEMTIFNSNKNILGMMPHPERMIDEIISNKDGVNIFSSLLN